jgi:hypothetical protein
VKNRCFVFLYLLHVDHVFAVLSLSSPLPVRLGSLNSAIGHSTCSGAKSVTLSGGRFQRELTCWSHTGLRWGMVTCVLMVSALDATISCVMSSFVSSQSTHKLISCRSFESPRNSFSKKCCSVSLSPDYTCSVTFTRVCLIVCTCPHCCVNCFDAIIFFSQAMGAGVMAPQFSRTQARVTSTIVLANLLWCLICQKPW